MKIFRNRAFTLLELMIVVGLLAIVLAAASPSFFRYRHNTNLRETVEDFSGMIALCKQRAVAENLRYRIVLDQGANEYSVERSQSPEALDVFVPSPDIGPVSFARHSAQVRIINGPVSIVAQPRGTLSNGTVVLQHDATNRRAEIITHISGRVNVRYFDG